MKPAACGVALQRRPPLMLELALETLRREGLAFIDLPPCGAEQCAWVRAVAECLKRGQCSRAVIFCGETDVAGCVTNKIPGVRAATVTGVAQAERAILGLGANVLIVDPADRTFFEFKEILRLGAADVACPPGVAFVLQELDGHAHR